MSGKFVEGKIEDKTIKGGTKAFHCHFSWEGDGTILEALEASIDKVIELTSPHGGRPTRMLVDKRLSILGGTLQGNGYAPVSVTIFTTSEKSAFYLFTG
jgi:hypothetical protein